MITLIVLYLFVALFTCFSILFEARWVGSKENYQYLYTEIRIKSEQSVRVQWFAYSLILWAASLLWPYVYYCRFKDWKG